MSQDNYDDAPDSGELDRAVEHARDHERGAALALHSMQVVLLDINNRPLAMGYTPMGKRELRYALREARKVGARSVVRVVAVIDRPAAEDRVH